MKRPERPGLAEESSRETHGPIRKWNFSPREPLKRADVRIRLPAFSVALVVALAGTPVAAARPLPGAPVPAGFVGVNLDGPPLTARFNLPLEPQFALMARSGVESVRATFNWTDEQPYRTWLRVPLTQRSQFEAGAGGIPTNFAETDHLVGDAAAHGLTVLPTVMYAPSWDAAPHKGSAINAPRSNQPYANFLTTLIDRYGPEGSFWAANPQLPRRPIREWAIWNEPWIYYYWPFKHYAKTYVALLRAARTAIKGDDPAAKVVLAGIPNASWRNFRSIVDLHGARSLFDVVDVHPYTEWPSGVIDILTRVRKTMVRVGIGRVPMIAGELSWNSSLHETRNLFDWDTTRTGQAHAVRTVLPLLAANRKRLNLVAFYWYTWMGNEHRGASPWNFAGLMGYHNGNVFAKSALSAFAKEAHAIEG
jgi:polysaccharide biosynthesis protein PslG